LNAEHDQERQRRDLAETGRAAVAFDPGLVRLGIVTARVDPVVEVAFAPPHRHALAVGAAVRIALDRRDSFTTPDRKATVVERCDRGDARRYRFALSGRRHLSEKPRRSERGADRAEGRRPAPRVTLRFGKLEVGADLVGATDAALLLRVTIDAESELASTDAIEIVVPRAPSRLEVRLAGWIERRVLEAATVRYEFRVDERLCDDGAVQHARLRSLLIGDPQADASAT